jgi:fructose-bisphosphate aldolase class II
MTQATLADVLGAANAGGFAVAGLVCLGWEDTRAYVAAAEAAGLPVILQAGPGARAHMPIAVWGTLFRTLAETATVPVVTHLDHGRTLDEVRAAIDAGFSSVMIDGSALPFAENATLSAQAARLAHSAGLSCEAELGVVGYTEGMPGIGTDPSEAALFVSETGIDALAVSVGNVHLQRGPQAIIDIDRVRAIMAATDVPLVLHGGSGVPAAMRRQLARATTVAKFNIGTELRQVFGAALRDALAADPAQFDRIALLRQTEGPLTAAAGQIIRDFGPPATTDSGPGANQ